MVDGIIAPPILVSDNDAIVRRHVHAVAWAEFDRARVATGGDTITTMAQLIDEPSSIADAFLDWLNTHPQTLSDCLVRIVPQDSRSALGIESWDWARLLQEPNSEGIGGWFTLLTQGARDDKNQLMAMEVEASEQKNYGRAQSLQRTQKTLDSRRILDRFAQRGILPKYGFPVDVVDLDLTSASNSNRVDLNRDLRLGILEFAPGSRVVADGRLWESRGLKQVSGRDLPQYEWGLCAGCGVLRTEFATADMKRDEIFQDPCPYCGTADFQRGQRGRFIIPLFGFVGALSSEKPGESRPPREGYLQTFFAEFDGPPPAVERVDLGGKPLGLRSSRRGWITVFNRGKTGHGFFYCSWCGYAGAERSRGRGPHKKPWGDQDCAGSLRPMDLGHRYLTNVLELHLPVSASAVSSEHAALSSLHAIISAAPTLGIAAGDIGGSLSVGPNGELVTVIFDDVPGGAGHTRFLKSHLPELIDAAIQRVTECSCGIDTSCYGCLRSYQNQREHDQLQRRAAIDVLAAIVQR